MTSTKVELRKQAINTNPTIIQKTVAKTTVPLFSVQNTQNDNLMGLKVEKTTQNKSNKNSQIKEVYLQSGRKIVIEKLSDGRSVYRYYSNDGKELKPNYFKKIEGEIRISSDGKSYTATKNGQTKTYKTKIGAEVKIAQQQAELNRTKKEQGLIGKSWDWLKNNTGWLAGSEKAQTQLDAEKELLKQIQSGKISKKDFKEVTGLDFTQENIQKFKQGILNLKSAQMVSAYKEGQDMAVEITSDIVSGAVAYGTAAACIAGGIAAAPFTAGASLSAVVVGVGIAAGAGAATKVAIKGGEALVGGKKYSLKQAGKDATIGTVSGALAPLTIGAGGAVTNSVSKVLPKFIATSARFAVEGGTFGAVDGGVRSVIEGGSIGDVALNTLKGAGIGIVAGNVLGHGGIAVGKGGQYIYEKFTPVYHGNGFTYRKNPFGNKYKMQLDKPDLEPLQFDLPNMKEPNWHPSNLTNELKRNHYGQKGIEKFLQENPNLSRVVGSLPQIWGKKLAGKNGLEKVDEIFYNFSKKYYNGTLNQKDISECEKLLSQVLNTKAEVKYLDEGMVGCVYTIKADGQTFVLKCFRSTPQVFQTGHGNYAELSSAVYASKHDPNHFARFYMGRFGEQQDGYMLTKFVEKADSKSQFKLSNFITPMSSGDLGHNVHGNTIIDYGAAWSDAILNRFNTNERKILRLLTEAIDNNKANDIDAIISKYSSSNDFINPVKYIKGLVHNYAFSPIHNINYKIKLKPNTNKTMAVDYFIERTACLQKLNIKPLESLNNTTINILPFNPETKGHISNIYASPWCEVGEKYYGLKLEEWRALGL